MISESGKLAGAVHAPKRADKYLGQRLAFESFPKEQSVLLAACV